MPVTFRQSGAMVLPSENTNTPAVPMADDLLTPDDAGIPRKTRYFLTELARFLCKEEPGDVVLQRRAEEATLRTLERLCERRKIRGLRIGRNIMVTRAELERVFVEMNTACDN